MATLSVIIPAYNEGPVIAQSALRLARAFEEDGRFDWTIRVVDNASTDHTSAAVLALGHPRILLLRANEKGKGIAVRRGFAAAEADVVAFTDADLSIEPDELLQAALLVRDGIADLVVGSRLLPESAQPGREWWRSATSGIFHRLAALIVGTNASDTQCPLKAMNGKGRALMLATRERTWFFDLEFLAFAERGGLSMREYPVTWIEHRYSGRRSKLSTTRDGLRAIIAMLRIRRRLWRERS